MPAKFADRPFSLTHASQTLSLSGSGSGQPWVLGSPVFRPGTSGQTSSASGKPSTSVSGGQPLVLGLSVRTPLTSGQASSESGMPSPSRSAAGAGGQPLVLGSSVRGPG